MSKRLIKTAVWVFLGILLVSLPIVGCDDDEGITTEQLREGIATAGDIETYQFDMKIMFEQIEPEMSLLKLSEENNATVDFSSKKMHEEVNRDYIVQETQHTLQGWEHYFIGDDVYGKGWFEQKDEETRWVKYAADTTIWDRKGEVDEQIELLEGSEIEISGSEKVNGVECWVVQLQPDLEQLWELGEGLIYGDKPADLGESMKNVSIKQWFAKDTYYLMKSELEWTVQLSESDSAFYWSELECSHYNEPVSIELPPEAAEVE